MTDASNFLSPATSVQFKASATEMTGRIVKNCGAPSEDGAEFLSSLVPVLVAPGSAGGDRGG